MPKSFEKKNLLHATVVYRSCNIDKLNDVAHLTALLKQMAAVSGFRILGEHFHQFDPMGCTGILLLSESHIAIHTWPEDRAAVLTFLTCGGRSPHAALELVRQGLGTDKVEIHMTPIRTLT